MKNMTTSEFNKMYADNKNDIMNYINWKINNIHDAEQLTTDVFIKAERLYNTFDAQRSNLNTWLRTITNSAIIDYYRTDHSDKYMAVSDFVNHETGEETFQFTSNKENNADFLTENAELSAKILKAFRGLKPKYRKIAMLYFVREKEYAEIAEICNVPMGSVKGMISRCREMLQDELQGLYHVRAKRSQIEAEA
jgi:RNA polymerase sigma-70 factor, ECF subfamily